MPVPLLFPLGEPAAGAPPEVVPSHLVPSMRLV
jgi:hypothetical protein